MRWTFEPGHTAAEFSVRHMMVCYVRGHFKGVHGTLEFDPADPHRMSVEAHIDADGLWSGDADRDAHLKSADFLDVENHPTITFRGDRYRCLGESDGLLTGDLTIRGVTRAAVLQIRDLGRWQTPWWEDGKDLGPITRTGFVATTRIRRQDFGVTWNAELERNGIVVGDDVEITIDVEATLDSDRA